MFAYYNKITMEKMPENFEQEEEKTPEQERISIIKRAAKDNVIKLAEEYMQTRRKECLSKIQELVDIIEDAFVLVIGQKDGVNYSVTFNPGEDTPEVPEENS